MRQAFSYFFPLMIFFLNSDNLHFKLLHKALWQSMQAHSGSLMINVTSERFRIQHRLRVQN